MKIGFVRRGHSATGGAEAYLRRLAQGVADAGGIPTLLTSKDWPEGKWPNGLVTRVGGDSPMAFARAVDAVAATGETRFSLERILRCDVYRAGDGVHRAWLERRAAFEPGWRRWTRWANRKHRELIELEARMFSPRHARRVIANSTMVRDEIMRFYDYPADRIDVIPNGYDAPPQPVELRARRRSELGLPEDAFLVLFAGSGWERKGLGVAIEAMKSLPDATLVVAGKGGAPRGTGRQVRFVGPRRDLQADFAAADVFVLPTVYDPFSNACLEALAAGLPVLTTSANGFSEVMIEGVHGSVLAPGDAAGLAARLREWRGRATSARGVCAERARDYSMVENVRRTLEAVRRAAP